MIQVFIFYHKLSRENHLVTGKNMHQESQQKKSASYAIEMMLKLSNCFEQMSNICRTAVVDFTKDLHLKQDYERISKYRIAQEPKREVISQSINSKIQEQMKKVQEIIPLKQNIVQKKKKSAPPKRLMQLQTVSVPSVEKKKQQTPPIQSKQQNIHKKQRPKDPILKQKTQPVEGKRIIRQSRKNSPKVNLTQISDLSSQPSDYKSRNKKRSQKSRSKSRKHREKRAKKVIDPSKKRPINGYLNFFIGIKDHIKEKYQVKTVPQMSHFTSVEWKKLSPSERSKYHNIYYENVEKMKAAQDNQNEPIQLEQHNQQTSSKKDNRKYLVVKRPQNQVAQNKDQSSSGSSGSSDSGSQNTDSNQENSESSSPKQSSEVKKKSKKVVIKNEKEVKTSKGIKIESIKQE